MFIDICQNCWESNSQLLKKSIIVSAIGLLAPLQLCWNSGKLKLKLLVPINRISA
jgi:hypothetical protein